jgi:hypothetical protein
MAAFFDGGTQLIGAWIVGFACAAATAGWLLAFDAHALTWLWGSLGEQRTGAELAKLDSDWHVVHDLPTPRGNWDHVLVGPPGVFVLDSKNLSGRITAYDDALTAGRLRLSSRSFRAAAFALSTALKQRLGPTPWIQAVVVIWGDFPQTLHHGDRVVYIAGEHLLQWLGSLDRTLPVARINALAMNIESLAKAE